MTQKQLERCCREWQKVLRLQDWDVKVGFVRTSDLECKTASAETRVKFNLKKAKIGIVEPEDVAPEDFDPESALVHELLHLHAEMPLVDLKAAETSQLQRYMVEQMVDCLAEGFVSLRRFA